MSLFDRLKFLAEKQGKSINDVERDMNYSKNTLYRLKTSNPSAKKLKELADYFNVSTDYLLERDETSSSKNVELSEDDVVFSLNGEKISKETMRKAIALAKALEENDK